MRRSLPCVSTIGAALTFCTTVPAMAEPFTYQGQLQDAGAPANGTYDFRFRLFNAPSDGGQIGPTIIFNDITVTNGVFQVVPDFGDVFNQNDAFLFIEVRPGASTGGYTGLLPRTPITAAPKAQYASAADTLLAPATIDAFSAAPTLTVNQSNTAQAGAALRATRGASNRLGSVAFSRLIELESVEAGIGVLSIAQNFPITGLLDANSAVGNTAAVLGQVQPGGQPAAIALWGLNFGFGTQARIATSDYAGDFTGNVRVNGQITRSYAPNSYDLATPIAYGFINAIGTVANGTPNISCVWNFVQNRYEVLIDGEDYFFDEYVTVVTPLTSNVSVRTSSGLGRLFVEFRNTITQNLVQSNFQFVTYKPDGAALVRGQQRPPLQPLLNTPFTDTDLHPDPTTNTPRLPVISEPITKSPLQRD